MLQHKIGFTIYPHDLSGFYPFNEAIKVVKEFGEGWRLPTKDELDLMYQYKKELSGFGAYSYWSSSEYSAYDTWAKDFRSSGQYVTDKKYGCRVRLVRNI